MKIGIDLSQIVYKTGVSRYTAELIKHLLKIDKNNQYVLFGSSLRQQDTLKNFIRNLKPCPTGKGIQASNVRTALYPIPPTILELLFNRIHLGDIQNLIGQVDVFHSSDWTQPKTSAKKVTTVHDLAVFKFPELFHPKIVEVQKRRLKLVKEECDKIIAVSANTKKDLVEVLRIPEERIEIIYEAASEKFNPRNENEIQKIKRSLGIKGEYILTVVTGGARKNLPNLVEAFKKASGQSPRNKNLKLVVAGQSEEVEVNDSIVKAGFLNDEELSALYSGSKVFVYPSIYEGFGLPVLEAMACGAPVVCSATSSLPEVGGEAAVYIDPDSAEDIASGIRKTLQCSKSEYETMRKKSQEQAKKFSWDKVAHQTLKIYEDLK